MVRARLRYEPKGFRATPTTSNRGYQVATFYIKAQYEYEGAIEADTPEEAEKIFLDDLNAYYSGTYSYECEEVCAECESEIGTCDCEEEAEDEEDGE